MLDRHRAFEATLWAAGAAALVHAGLAWSPADALRFGLVAVGLAFVAETVVVNAGWLVHRLGPQVAGVPVPVLAGWVAATYVAYWTATLLVEPGTAPVVAAALATAADLLGDPVGVRAGFWTYPDGGLPGPTIADVPWWNFAGWLALTCVVGVVGAPT